MFVLDTIVRNWILNAWCRYDVWQTRRLCKQADEYFASGTSFYKRWAPIHIGSELHTVVIPEDFVINDGIDSMTARGDDGPTDEDLNGLHYITEMPSDWYEGHWFSGPGWYWADEADLLDGPFDTREIAIEQREFYCHYYL